MKILKFAALAAIISLPMTVDGRTLQVEKLQKMELPQEVYCQIPTISPDGSYVIVGTMGTGTLNKIDLNTGEMSLVAENGDADALVISPDGRNIVFRNVTFDKKKMRQTALHSVNIENGKETQLVKPSRRLNSGFSVTNSRVSAVESGKMKKMSISKGDDTVLPVASINYGDLQVTVNGKTNTINPQGEGSYLWPSVSPDGTKVAYYFVGEGAFVCNLDGSNPQPVGYIHAPRWYGNDMVIGMEDYDDGRVITKSSIVASDMLGTHQTLTDANVKAMYPSASADGSKIVFSTDEGELYLMTIK